MAPKVDSFPKQPEDRCQYPAREEPWVTQKDAVGNLVSQQPVQDVHLDKERPKVKALRANELQTGFEGVSLDGRIAICRISKIIIFVVFRRRQLLDYPFSIMRKCVVDNCYPLP